MKFETVRHVSLPKIGFGTWKIGGGSSANSRMDAGSMAALRSALEIGYTHFDTAEMYAGGHAEELIGRVVRETHTARETLFITSKVMPSHLQYDQVMRACETSLRHLQMDYIDLYLIHWPQAGMKLEDTFKALNKLVQDGKIRHLGVSNFNVKLLKQAQSLSKTPILTNQVPYSVVERSYVENGVLEYCQANDILLTAYSPVEEGNLRTSKVLNEIAQAHQATPYQIALAWLVMQPRVITIPMSADPQHQKENFHAADIQLSAQEMKLLSDR
jgi:diketogulonate reductase-like aldo/keto reductase